MNGSQEKLRKQLESAIFGLKKEITIISERILCQFPIETFLADVKSCPVIDKHKYMWRKLKKVNKKMLTNHNKSVCVLYNKLVLALCMKESLGNLEQKGLSESIIHLYKKWFERVLKDFSQLSDNYYDKSNAFRYDLGVCSLSVIPVGGAWIIDTSRASMKLFFTSGLRQFIKFFVLTVFKQGGIKPYFVIHTFNRYLPLINSEEMEKAYLRIAELLKKNPEIKGIYRCSWFLDPMIDTISPQLSYLRKIPLQNGAMLFRKESGQNERKYAIFNSLERKKLFLEKKYTPISYAYIWPRNEVLKWADRKTGNKTCVIINSLLHC